MNSVKAQFSLWFRLKLTGELDVPVVLITSIDSKSINRSHFRTDLFDFKYQSELLTLVEI